MHSPAERGNEITRRDQARDYFTRFTGLFKNFNYAREDSPDYQRYLKEIDALAKSIGQ